MAYWQALVTQSEAGVHVSLLRAAWRVHTAGWRRASGKTHVVHVLVRLLPEWRLMAVALGSFAYGSWATGTCN